MFSITPSHIIEYLYCARYTFFEYVLAVPQNEDKYYKVQRGRTLHDEKLERNKGYLRKRIGAVEKWEDQYLTNATMRGRIDEVLKLEDGSFAPLDYKFAEYKDKLYDTYKQQLFCYAVLIEDNWGAKVNRGFIVYIRSKNKLLEVEIKQSDKELIRESISGFLEIVEKNHFPKATKYKRRCVNCTYRNICTK
ncbi:CRISPR-associated protein Cas4 [Cryomorpha ignava]|uniref:CRISPR-associated exonuclease Cas4 n=1 Tax=Cryomorpha ignava TaxID=101383 RepID=A0A7K3WMB5_9FLAO|nr:CRISPR-associated protein Cas4 [Cryomorpha ignava]NEN22787.1 CRISPR-associated protein Cas4 [Cryomorpha ignava]